VIGRRWFENIDKLSNTIYNTGEWPKDFTEVTMIALKKKTKDTKCSDLEEGLKIKLRMCLEKISLDLEEEKELGMQKG